MAASCRSNGVMLAGFIIHYYLSALIHAKSRNLFDFLLAAIRIAISLFLIALPFIGFQYYAFTYAKLFITHYYNDI